MADEPLLHEEFSDAHNAEMSEMSDEITELNQKINDLEQENSGIVRENKEFKHRVEELKASVEKLSSENEDLKNQVEKAQSENKATEAVAARAAVLEGEVARLHHDLAAATSDLQESNGDLSGLKRELEGVKGREKEKDVKLEAAEREKALLGAELDAKDKQIQDLKKNVGDLAVVMGNGLSSETEKNEWETKIEKMKEEIGVLRNSLDKKERVIREKKTAVLDAVNGDGGKKGLIGGLRQSDWLVVGGTTIAAVAVMGLVCYVRAARKH